MAQYKVSDIIIDPNDGALGIIIARDNDTKNWVVDWFFCNISNSRENEETMEGFIHHSI